MTISTIIQCHAPICTLLAQGVHHIATMENIRQLVTATGVLAAASCATSLTGLALIVYVKGYKHFLYRLTFHLALASLMRAFFIGASAIPVDVARSNGSDVAIFPGTVGLCAFMGGARQYTYLWCATAVMWTCLYVIKKGCWVSTKRGYEDITDLKENKWIIVIKRHKYEISGHVIVALLPTLVFWIPYADGAYGISGPWCWVHENDGKHDAGLLAFRIVFRLPAIIGSITCITLLSYIVGKYCRKARVQGDPWQLAAVRKVAPVMIYPIIFAIASIASILHPIVRTQLQNREVTNKANDVEMIFLTIFFIYDASITLSLFLHKDIRGTLYMKRPCKMRSQKDPINFGMEEDDESKDSMA